MLPKYLILRRLDYRMLFVMLSLMVVSIFVISATTYDIESSSNSFFTPLTIKQLAWFFLGSGCFLFFTLFDYRMLRKLSIGIYLGALFMLVGLFFVEPIHNVRRWYRLPLIPFDIQPSEYAKLAIVLMLSWHLERNIDRIEKPSVIIGAFAIILVPFVLILKQPDLGTALVLMPIFLVMLYFAGVKKKIITLMSVGFLSGLALVVMMFLGVLSHESIKPYALKVVKEYQFERLNPNTYHQKAAQTAIALGQVSGSGWKQSEFTGKRWLPYAHTDSAFPAFAEEFGLIGATFVIMLLFLLTYFSFQISALSKDLFGRFLSAGIAVYLAIHIVINIGMMCGLLPITGVPLVMVSYGGSFVLTNMIALGILQSIYVRRYMFS